MSPEWVMSSASAALANPKSATQTLPLGSSSRLDGLTSRWSTPWRLAYSSASATCNPMRATLRKKVRSGSDRASESAEAPGRLITEEPAGPGDESGGPGERGRRGGRQRGAGTRYSVGPFGERKPSGEDGFGHVRGADCPVGRNARSRWASTSDSPPQPAQFLQDGVEAHAGDELHDVVVMAVVPTHAEDRHDVGVVQPRRGPRLPLEAQHLLGVGRAASGRTFSATRRPSDSCSAS